MEDIFCTYRKVLSSEYEVLTELGHSVERGKSYEVLRADPGHDSRLVSDTASVTMTIEMSETEECTFLVVLMTSEEVYLERGAVAAQLSISELLGLLNKVRVFIKISPSSRLSFYIADKEKEEPVKETEDHPFSNEDIQRMALDLGYTLRLQPDGTMDLNEYVYRMARMCFNRGRSFEKNRRHVFL